MSEKNLGEKLEQLRAEVALLRQELTYLKTHQAPQPQLAASHQSKVKLSTSRRRLLKGLTAGLLVGVVGVATGPAPAEAKIMDKSGRIGQVIATGGDGATGDLPANTSHKYGLIALSGTGNFDLSSSSNNYLANVAVFARSSDTGVASYGNSTGVYAKGTNTGVYGISSATGVVGSGGTYGVVGSGGTYGVHGSGSTYGVYGTGSSYGVYGNSDTYGVYGTGNDTGIYGIGSDTGVHGLGDIVGVGGESSSYGVCGIGGKIGTVGTTINTTLFNALPANTAIGLLASAGLKLDLNGSFANNHNIGVYAAAGTAQSRTAKAGIFSGNVDIIGNLAVTGTISGALKAFKIDHPLDPANKYLYHSAVESPDMLTIYIGLATLDEQGEGTVELPEWFEALNADYRYQLTSIGVASPQLYIAKEIEGGQFNIGGGQPGQKVSWQVTGIRKDEWAKAHCVPVEETKPEEERGYYLHPELYGYGPEQSVNARLRVVAATT